MSPAYVDVAVQSQQVGAWHCVTAVSQVNWEMPFLCQVGRHVIEVHRIQSAVILQINKKNIQVSVYWSNKVVVCYILYGLIYQNGICSALLLICFFVAWPSIIANNLLQHTRNGYLGYPPYVDVSRLFDDSPDDHWLKFCNFSNQLVKCCVTNIHWPQTIHSEPVPSLKRLRLSVICLRPTYTVFVTIPWHAIRAIPVFRRNCFWIFKFVSMLGAIGKI